MLASVHPHPEWGCIEKFRFAGLNASVRGVTVKHKRALSLSSALFASSVTIKAYFSWRKLFKTLRTA